MKETQITRDAFIALLRAGRMLVPATYNERQDYVVVLSDNPRSPFIRPYRDITDEPAQLAVRRRNCARL